MIAKKDAALYRITGMPDAVAVGDSIVSFVVTPLDGVGRQALTDFRATRGPVVEFVEKSQCDGAVYVSVGASALSPEEAQGVRTDVHLYPVFTVTEPEDIEGTTQVRVPGQQRMGQALDDLISIVETAVANTDIADLRAFLKAYGTSAGEYQTAPPESIDQGRRLILGKPLTNGVAIANMRLSTLDGAVRRLDALVNWLNANGLSSDSLMTATVSRAGTERVGLFLW